MAIANRPPNQNHGVLKIGMLDYFGLDIDTVSFSIRRIRSPDQGNEVLACRLFCNLTTWEHIKRKHNPIPIMVVKA
jgi:hypothetical protein